MNESDLVQELRALRPAAPSEALARKIEAELEGAGAGALNPRKMPVAGEATVALRPSTLPTPTARTGQALTAARTSGVIEPKQRKASSLFFGLCWAAGGAAAGVLLVLCFFSPRTGHDRLALLEAQSAATSETAAEQETEDPNLFQQIAAEREVLATEDAGIYYEDQETPTHLVRYTSMERQSWTNRSGAMIEILVPREDLVAEPASYQ